MLQPGTYTLWAGDKQLAGSTMGGNPGMMPGGMGRPDHPNQMQPSEGQRPPEGSMPPEGFTPPAEGGRPEMPEGNPPQRPESNKPDRPGGGNPSTQEQSPDFIIRDGGNMFSNISYWN